MTDSKPVQIADALVSAINTAASGFSITSFTCQRDYKPVVKLEELDSLQLRVIPGPAEAELSSRSSSRFTSPIVVSVQKQATTTAAADALDYFAQEVADFIGLTTTSDPQRPAGAVYVGHEVTDSDTLGGLNLPAFAKLIRIRYLFFQ